MVTQVREDFSTFIERLTEDESRISQAKDNINGLQGRVDKLEKVCLCSGHGQKTGPIPRNQHEPTGSISGTCGCATPHSHHQSTNAIHNHLSLTGTCRHNTVPSSSPPVYASPMATPAPYAGSAEDCSGFLLQCELVLEMQPHLYPNDTAKIAFLISQLRGKALKWADSIWSQHGAIMQSYSSFTSHFREVFGKPITDSSAGEKLYNLKQGSMSIYDYALQFRTLAAISGWNEQGGQMAVGCSGVLVALLLYTLFVKFTLPIEIFHTKDTICNTILNNWYDKEAYWHEQTNKINGVFGYGEYNLAVTLAISNRYYQRRKRKETLCKKSTNNAMIICICLLLLGDIHQCPGPTGRTNRANLPNAPTCSSGASLAAVLPGGVYRDPALARVNPCAELRWSGGVGSCADGVLDLRRGSPEGQRFASAESAPAAAIVSPELGDASMRHLGLDGPGLCRGSPGGRPAATGEATAEVGGPSEGGPHGVGGVSTANIHKRFTVNKAICMNRNYRQGLEPRVRLHLAAYEDNIGLEKFIQLSIRCATRMQPCLQEHQGQSFSTSLLCRSEPVSSPEPANELMEVENSRLTPTERHRRLTLNLCLYCMSSPHAPRDHLVPW
ncbi:Retrotransposon-like protein 1 [Anabarilius grahami]|uniref:Retrotransposon-like protein 1 n=1 Tax=Anabarilius grahami TaxID=495550 RepID=A0A3N0Z4C9_ANAGA|nr:Retrotransposon-like protein 1 [Anabarilius grahami]